MNWKKLLRFLRPILKATARAAINQAVDEAKLANWLCTYSFVRQLLEPQHLKRLAKELKGFVLKAIEAW